MSAGLDAYRPRGSALELSIGLTRDDVAGLAGAGAITFGLPGAAAIEGAVEVSPGVVAAGLRRIVDYYVLGMHAAYGLSNFAAPTPFLLLLRQLADDLYVAIRGATGAAALVDVSDTNTEMEAIVRALYPDAFALPLPTGSPSDRPAVAGRASSEKVGAPVIVVGFPRSGTTWLQRMLQSHPSLAGPEGETCLFTSVRDVLDNEALRALAGRDAVVAAVRRFARALCAHWQEHNATDAARLVEKTPSNVDNLDTIVELFPDASIIGIYRDGRDVVESLLQVEFGTDDAVTAAQGWARSVRKLQAFAAKSDRVRVLRYEELRADPVAGVVELLRWLGLPADEAVQAILTQHAGTPVSQHRVRERAWSPRDERAVYRFAGDLLVELGYAAEREVRAVKRQPGYAVDLARRKASRLLMRNR